MQREAARKAGSNDGPSLVRTLEVLSRLHDAPTADRLIAAAAEAFSVLLGSAPSVVRMKFEGLASQNHPAEDLGSGAVAMMDRAARQGLPVLDPQVPGAAAFPIATADRSVGSVYVAHADPAVMKGQAFDLVRVLAAHVGIAAVTLDLRLAAACTPAAASRVGTTASLKVAKREFERRIIDARLRESRGNVAAAARSLDIDRGQLSRLMKRHELVRGAFRAEKGPRQHHGQGPVKGPPPGP